ncbi:hypothetical protein [Paraclostridium dentum]|uniref:hypothetical protein n=1 Tax=Paraclostridium dentum TaxID=2662455 RepID=UPI003F33FB9B
MNFNLDSTIIVAMIGLFGTIYTVKTNALLTLNKQLMEMVESQNELIEAQRKEIEALKEQYKKESKRLEHKILVLTGENTSLRKEIIKLQQALSGFKSTNE